MDSQRKDDTHKTNVLPANAPVSDRSTRFAGLLFAAAALAFGTGLWILPFLLFGIPQFPLAGHVSAAFLLISFALALAAAGEMDRVGLKSL
jgi:hypothetical protein